MNIDLDYALRQLRAIVSREGPMPPVQVYDRVQRAIDAIERVQEAEVNAALNLELPAIDCR